MASVSLNTLLPGEEAVIERVDAAALTVRQRLLEMGLTKGTSIQMIRFAPMGDPVEISVRGYRLSLRRVEADSVIVSKKRDQ